MDFDYREWTYFRHRSISASSSSSTSPTSSPPMAVNVRSRCATISSSQLPPRPFDLPDIAVQRIFSHLSIRDKVLFARVSTQFRRISESSLASITRIDLRDRSLENVDCSLTSDGLDRLIEKCARRLRFVIYGCPYEMDDLPRPNRRLCAFSRFACPNVIALDMGGARVDTEQLRSIFTNCANIESFKSGLPTIFEFPTDVVCPRMREAHFQLIQPNFLFTFVGACPNLSKLSLNYYNSRVQSPTQVNLDRLFGMMTNLRDFEFRTNWLSLYRYQFLEMRNFWLLPLRSLSLRCHSIDDLFMWRVSRAFRDLESLTIHSHEKLMTMEESLANVSGMPRLKRLVVHNHPIDGVYTVENVKQLVDRDCGRLEVIHLGDAINPDAIKYVIKNCINLREFFVHRIDSIETSATDDALAFVRELRDFPQRNLHLYLNSYMHVWELWESQPVLDAMDEYLNSTDGRRMRISIPNGGWFRL